MPQDPTPTGPDVERLKVPEELLQRLHGANESLHVAKKRLEEAMDETSLVFRHEQNVEERFAELRLAEKDLEEISGIINEILGRKA
jgi:succinate dehydrogenase/fumarate reductase flavoprotein subunit